MNSINVAILRGGTSLEHEISLKSGMNVLQKFPRDTFTVRDIYIDKAGVWHERGMATTPARVLPTTDVALILLHGSPSDESSIQHVLEQYGVPYSGADTHHAHLAKHKVLAKEHARSIGLKTAKYQFIENEGEADTKIREAVRSFIQPVVVKAVSGGSSIGTTLASGFSDVHKAVTGLFESGAHGVLVEEYIKGREASVGVVEGIRGSALYTLPVVEITPHGDGIFSYDAKYSGKSSEVCPGNFTEAEKAELGESARKMHTSLNQHHYSRTDFIVTPRGIYFLEINTAGDVGLTRESLLPRALGAVGIGMEEFLLHIVGLARNAHKR